MDWREMGNKSYVLKAWDTFKFKKCCVCSKMFVDYEGKETIKDHEGNIFCSGDCFSIHSWIFTLDLLHGLETEQVMEFIKFD